MTVSEDDRVAEELRRAFDEAVARASVTLDRSFTVAQPPRPRQQAGRVVVACLAVVVLFAVSFGVVHSESTAPTVSASGRSAIEPAAPGWRWEMWANVQLQVPDTWDRNRDIHRECRIDDDIPGFVSRPDGSGIMEFCPDWTQASTTLPSLAFLDALPETPTPGTRTYPNGTVTVRKVGSTKVMVTAKDDALRRRILGSAEVVTGTNAAGCPVGAHIPAVAHAVATGPSIADLRNLDLISICRYHPGSVAYSYTQSGAKAAAIVAALRRADTGVGPNDPKDCVAGLPENDAGLYRLWSGSVVTDVWVHWDNCVGHGIDDSTSTRRLTADVLAPLIGVAYGGGTSKSVPTRTSSTKPGMAPVYEP